MRRVRVWQQKEAAGTHMVLPFLSSIGILDHADETARARADVMSNKNPILFDARNPSKCKRLRLGVSAVTTRGLGTPLVHELGGCIADLLLAESRSNLAPALARVKPWIERPGRWCGQ